MMATATRNGFSDEVTALNTIGTPAGLLRLGFIKIESKGLELDQFKTNLLGLFDEFKLITLSKDDFDASKEVVRNYRGRLESSGENEKSDMVREIFCKLLDCNSTEVESNTGLRT